MDPRSLARFVGPPIDETFRLLTGIEDDREIDLLVERYRERYGDVGYSENRVYPGISETLTELSQHGAHLAVCTSKRGDFAERILEFFGLRAFFDFVDGGDVGITKRQQIGELLLRGAITRATLMIGDRAVDIEAARSNDLEAAGVLWGYGSRAELDAAGPRFMFSTPGELPRLLPL